MTLENRVSDLEQRADEWGARLAATLNGLLDSLDEDGAAHREHLTTNGSDLPAGNKPEDHGHD